MFRHYGGIHGSPKGRKQKPLGIIRTKGQPGQSRPAPSAVGGAETPRKSGQVEALWNGVLYGCSGYAKANREILRRVAAFASVRLSDDAPWNPSERDPEVLSLHSHHRSISVSSYAPRVTFLPPQDVSHSGYRVIYTMMETEKVHPNMIRIMNDRYDECWVPTHWNKGTFQRSGLKIPTYVMSLGVDPAVYTPAAPPFVPKATLLTGPHAGRLELPRGFLFISVFQPSFRKGHDVLIKAFEEAFGGDQEAGLVLGTTAYALSDVLPWKSMKSRIWALQGAYSESQLASVYRGCKAYVCASRGEGFNLPVVEAGAVGLPVIVPRTSVHPELVPEGLGYFFDSDSKRVFEEGKKVSPWFDGIEFPDYGEKSRAQLVGLMRGVKKNYTEAVAVGHKFMAHVSSKLTWDLAAGNISRRLREICARGDV